MASPRPVPPNRRVVDVSACENGSNSVGSARPLAVVRVDELDERGDMSSSLVQPSASSQAVFNWTK
jgi:hypothetical protein